MLIFLKTTIPPIRNAAKKASSTKKEPHGRGCCRAAARRKRLEWVRGKT